MVFLQEEEVSLFVCFSSFFKKFFLFFFGLTAWLQDLTESEPSIVKTQNPNHRPPGNSLFFFLWTHFSFLLLFLPHTEFSTDIGALSFLGIVAMRL